LQIKTDKKLVVAGGTSHSDIYVENIKRLAKRDDRLILTGFVQGDVLTELYSNCFAYILPSDVEGMPLTLLDRYNWDDIAKRALALYRRRGAAKMKAK
jgi:glycosyltransferase involved in cell wall biosynthesis